jgi:hypothetical protein
MPPSLPPGPGYRVKPSGRQISASHGEHRAATGAWRGGLRVVEEMRSIGRRIHDSPGQTTSTALAESEALTVAILEPLAPPMRNPASLAQEL